MSPLWPVSTVSGFLASAKANASLQSWIPARLCASKPKASPHDPHIAMHRRPREEMTAHAANRSASAGDDKVGHVGYWLVTECGVDLV
jgi:hypothetical protein